MPIKIQDGIDLIRSKGGLKAWTDLQIHQAIHRAIKECALTYTVDGEGEIDGLCFGKWTSFDYTGLPHEFHVIYITGKLEVFIQYLKDTFPSCVKITGERQGKVIEYNF